MGEVGNDVLRRRAAMLFSEEAIASADRFGSFMQFAFDECGVDPEGRAGYLIGWLYGQLRKRMPAEQVRWLFESMIKACEEKLAVLEKHSK